MGVRLLGYARNGGISEVFIRWVKPLFQNATTTVNLNGSPEESFNIEQGVRQGCPLVPYVFLIVGDSRFLHTSLRWLVPRED